MTEFIFHVILLGVSYLLFWSESTVFTGFLFQKCPGVATYLAQLDFEIVVQFSFDAHYITQTNSLP